MGDAPIPPDDRPWYTRRWHLGVTYSLTPAAALLALAGPRDPATYIVVVLLVWLALVFWAFDWIHGKRG